MQVIKIIALYAFILLTVLFPILCTGCATTGLQRDAGDVIAANARSAGRLEATISDLDGIIEDSRERLEIVARAGERITDGVDKLEYLLGEYEQEVGRLLDEVDSLRNKVKAEGEDNSSTNVSTSYSYYY